MRTNNREKKKLRTTRTKFAKRRIKFISSGRKNWQKENNMTNNVVQQSIVGVVNGSVIELADNNNNNPK